MYLERMHKKFFFQLLDKLNGKASEFMKMKALAYWLNNSVKLIEETEHHIFFKILPIDGYNKNIRIVEFYPSTGKFFCYRITKKGNKTECDGFRKNGLCSHILAAIYYYLKTTGIRGSNYFKLKDKALKFIKQWRKKSLRK